MTQICTYKVARRVRGRWAHPQTPRVELCFEPGCFRRGSIECYLSDNPSQTPDEVYCADHARKNGYCWGCGNFWAGVESFDFRESGLCDNCKDDPDLTGEYDYEDYPDDYDAASDDLPF